MQSLNASLQKTNTHEGPAKILMFAWELLKTKDNFEQGPLDIAQELLKLKGEITFVIPDQKNLAALPSIRFLTTDELISDEKIIERLNHLHYQIVIPSSPTNTKTTKGEDESIQIHYKPSTVININKNPEPDLISQVVSYSFAASEIAQKENFDVIYAFEWVSFLAGIEAKKISKKPLIVYLSERECDRSADNCPIAIYQLEKHGLEMADKIILPSQKGLDNILKQYKLDPRKIVILNKKSASIKESPSNKKQFIQV